MFRPWGQKGVQRGSLTHHISSHYHHKKLDSGDRSPISAFTASLEHLITGDGRCQRCLLQGEFLPAMTR
ncbi:hypothetical protein E2C01_081908 [Portunus trituberculatus]|uniref:Uncharacterized protein n=1 Tax=Portunus trituberculatus TaxID=210409 RepID=A0A5B7IR09_PORTR|nr:hypothetical protein [Portunus trituberculatus]